MSYLKPAELLPLLADAGAQKISMSIHKVMARSFMAGAILAVSAVFAITVSVQTGYPIIGAILFPIGFCLLNLLQYDLLTGAFVLGPLAWLHNEPNITLRRILKNWALVFVGNFIGACFVAYLTAIVFTYGFTTAPNEVGEVIAEIGKNRTVGYKDHGAGGMLTIFVRGVLCNWMVSLGVIGAYIATSVNGKITIMWLPIMLFFGMAFEHSIVNMYLFPAALMLGGQFSISDYLLWNELPVVLGNLVGGMLLTGLPLYISHGNKTARPLHPLKKVL
ncbi:formate/nitrite transporter family protein [Amylibacter sp. SFDW26]|uniref:formate/nitrite transporter family protein n=1 Tax=Amylibacter sp. SFDW26 TaxID=2652722 RepID=UPI001261E676|nr:formate/nitrite transporter family protein [Amylibacter sp. SFDW26]KAB7613760.1 formate/nitrite transporter family protein [Amylibacter sp. SFDW26]